MIIIINEEVKKNLVPNIGIMLDFDLCMQLMSFWNLCEDMPNGNLAYMSNLGALLAVYENNCNFPLFLCGWFTIDEFDIYSVILFSLSSKSEFAYCIWGSEVGFFFFPLLIWYLSLHLDDFVQIVKENVDIGLLSCIYFL